MAHREEFERIQQAHRNQERDLKEKGLFTLEADQELTKATQQAMDTALLQQADKILDMLQKGEL